MCYISENAHFIPEVYEIESFISQLLIAHINLANFYKFVSISQPLT